MIMEWDSVLIVWVKNDKESDPLVYPKRGCKLPTKVVIPDISGSFNYWEYINRLGNKSRYHKKGTENALGYYFFCFHFFVCLLSFSCLFPYQWGLTPGIGKTHR
jgi:hypothetical protein